MFHLQAAVCYCRRGGSGSTWEQRRELGDGEVPDPVEHERRRQGMLEVGVAGDGVVDRRGHGEGAPDVDPDRMLAVPACRRADRGGAKKQRRPGENGQSGVRVGGGLPARRRERDDSPLQPGLQPCFDSCIRAAAPDDDGYLDRNGEGMGGGGRRGRAGAPSDTRTPGPVVRRSVMTMLR